MDNLNLVEHVCRIQGLKNIDKSTMIGVLEDVFRHLLIKTYETDENFDVIIIRRKGTSKYGETVPSLRSHGRKSEPADLAERCAEDRRNV